MSRKRTPVSALRATGSRHYSKNELEAREASEPSFPTVAKLAPPAYLAASLAKKFDKLAEIVSGMGVTEADADVLARYVIADSNYLRATNRLTTAINAGNTAEADKWSAMQDRFFKQCRQAAADLGLTAMARIAVISASEDAEEADGDLYGP